MDWAKTLWVAVWLHWLDMATGGEALASETLEASRHHLGPLLESFLTLRTSNLTFQEVVDCTLKENHRAVEQSLHHLQGCHVHDHRVLEGLIKAHRELDKSDKATQKSLKKEIDQRCKSLEMLKERISCYETQLGQEPSEGNTPNGDGQVGHGAQAEMAPALAPADDAPSESTMTPVTPAADPPPAEDQLRTWRWTTMPHAPVYPAPSLMRMMTYCWACLKVRQLRWSQAWLTSLSHLQGARMGRVRKPPIRRHSPSHTTVTGRHFLWVPPQLPGRRREATQLDEEGPIKPTNREDSGVTLLRGFFL